MDPYTPTNTEFGGATPSMRTSEIRRIEVMSVAKLTGALYGAIGLLFGGLYGAMMALMGVVGAATGEPEALIAVVMGVAMVVIIPLFYGVLGGLFAAFGAFVYNVVASQLGGIRFELHDV